jgi:hypothetical protein
MAEAGAVKRKRRKRPQVQARRHRTGRPQAPMLSLEALRRLRRSGFVAAN